MSDNFLDTFALAFNGQKITVTTTLSMSTHSVDGNLIETVPIFYEGILLDTDKEFYYLGYTPHEISQAVRRSNIVHIMVIDEKDLFEELLNKMPDPNRQEDVN